MIRPPINPSPWSSMLLRRDMNPRFIVCGAALCLLVFSTLPLVPRLMPLTSTAVIDVLDAIRGAMLGMAIALVAVGGILKRRRES